MFFSQTSATQNIHMIQYLFKILSVTVITVTFHKCYCKFIIYIVKLEWYKLTHHLVTKLKVEMN